jgi:inner membrane protein
VHAGLLLSTLYLAWTAVAQAYVRAVAVESLPPVVRKHDRILVTPSPFNTVLWRVVAMRPEGGYEEGFYSFAADGPRIRFHRIAPTPVPGAVRELTAVQRMEAFSHGFCTVHVGGGKAWVTDLRMGQEPYYSFSFLVARQESDRWVEVTPRNEGSRGSLKRGLQWVWSRLWDRNVAPL